MIVKKLKARVVPRGMLVSFRREWRRHPVRIMLLFLLATGLTLAVMTKF